LKRLRAGPTKEEIIAAEQALAAREAELALTRAGRKELDALKAALAIRQGEKRQAEASLDQIKKTRQADVALAEETVEAARAELGRTQETVKQRQADLDDTRIVTQIAGVVTRIYPEVGEFCRTGETAILVARQSGDFWVNAYVRERDAPLIGVGQPARIKVLAGSRDWVEAEVTQVSAHTQARDAVPEPGAATGQRGQGQRVWVKLRPKEPLEEGLKHGMSARAVIRVR
jgi:multidrug resistance efflux pump